MCRALRPSVHDRLPLPRGLGRGTRSQWSRRTDCRESLRTAEMAMEYDLACTVPSWVRRVRLLPIRFATLRVQIESDHTTGLKDGRTGWGVPFQDDVVSLAPKATAHRQEAQTGGTNAKAMMCTFFLEGSHDG